VKASPAYLAVRLESSLTARYAGDAFTFSRFVC